MKLWAKLCCRIVGLEVEARGEVPPPGFVVANHCGYIDVLLLASQLDACFVAKAEIENWPLLGTLSKRTGTIFIERSAIRDVVRVSLEMRNARAAGRHVVLFPEAKSSDGSAVLPFRSALLEVPVAEKEPVWPAAIGYRTPEDEPPAGEAVCWWGDARFAPHLWRLLGIRRIHGRIDFLPRVEATSRRELAQQTHELIAAAIEFCIASR